MDFNGKHRTVPEEAQEAQYCELQRKRQKRTQTDPEGPEGAREVQYSGLQRKAQKWTRTDPEVAQEVRYYCLDKAEKREVL